MLPVPRSGATEHNPVTTALLLAGFLPMEVAVKRGARMLQKFAEPSPSLRAF
jgi:hypothetical protein